jgi:small subunit ribosomal protein S8
MSRDIIGDFLTVMRNALLVYKREIVVPSSTVKVAIAQVLKDEGFIKDFQMTQKEGKTFLNMTLKYVNGQPAINEILRISKPGCRAYERSNNITQVVGGLGVSILTTNRGIMTDRQARELAVGGEVICHIW